MQVNRRQALQGLTALAIPAVGRGGLAAWAAADDGVTVTGKQLRVHGGMPYNAEPELESLVGARITALPNFYVRNHGPIPQLDAAEFRLSVDGLVQRPRSWNLAELQRQFPSRSIEATLTCAGNRRVELNAIRPVAGVPWRAGAIGNAQWDGAALADLLRAAGLRPEARHVWFEGADPVAEKDGSVAPFGGSIPLDKALSGEPTTPGALIAYRMNGQPLLPAHGFPFRSVVPGYIGARSVKWLGKIVVSDRPSPNHYVADAYKLVQSDAPAERAAADPIYEYVVNGVIGWPSSATKVAAGKLRVQGYALPGGQAGSVVKQVEVSADGGRSWQEAQLLGDARPFCWQLWTLEMSITGETRELIARVRDSLGHEQPETGRWNFKGYSFNGWHHQPLDVSG